MLQPTNLYQEAARRLLELTKARREIEYRLSRAPHGTIHIVNSRGRIQFYLRTRKSENATHPRRPQNNSEKIELRSSQNPFEEADIYLSPRKDRARIQSLLRKRYDEKAFSQIQIEIANLTAFLGESENIIETIQSIYSDYPPQIKQFLNPLDLSDADYISQWLSVPYEPKTITETAKTYETLQGERVRSKSELNIANALYLKNIPYKYECPLQLSTGALIYPDFTILNVRQRREIYWEHRGMMDDRTYATHSVMRIKDYVRNGYVLGRDLIITEETAASPLGTGEIDAVIRDYCL